MFKTSTLIFLALMRGHFQQTIAMTISQSSFIFLKWINFVVQMNTPTNACSFKDSKFYVFADYFNSIVNEETSLVLNVHVNGNNKTQFQPTLKLFEGSYTNSKKISLKGVCDETQPIECSSGGLIVCNGKFKIQAEIKCTEFVIANNEPQKPMMLFSKPLTDSDISELEHEAKILEENNPRFKQSSDIEQKVDIDQLMTDQRSYLQKLRDAKNFILLI